MRYPALIAILVVITFGCKSNEGYYGSEAFIGGEIINPKNSSIAIYCTQGELIDSVELDVNNRFSYKLQDLEPGLYSFFHGGEYQMMFLEPNDSIMFRLNTFDFDESLVFTGEGANKNNYLIKSFLSNEKEAKKLVKYSKMEPDEFSSFVEERRLKQLNEFQDFLVKNVESELFKSIVEADINYNCYADKEIYPFAYFGNNKLIHVKDLPEDFYAYRGEVNYNANHLSHFLAYNRFLSYHIDNLALKSYYKNNAYHSKFNRHSMDYNKSKLDLIDTMIKNQAMRNKLLKNKTRDFISNNHTEEEANELLEYYLSKSTNDEDKAYISSLVNSFRRLRQGNQIPNLSIVNYNNSEHDLSAVISKPTIIYFWSSNSKKQYRNSHYVVSKLKKKFPYVDFISININDNDDKYWKDVIGNYNFPTENEFKFKDSQKASETLVVNYLNKAIIVDRNGDILHPNVNIFNSDFENTLVALLQKKRPY